MGRVDGKGGGRGSYSGLEDALQNVLDTITGTGTSVAAGAGPSFLITVLNVGEEVLSNDCGGAGSRGSAQGNCLFVAMYSNL